MDIKEAINGIENIGILTKKNANIDAKEVKAQRPHFKDRIDAMGRIKKMDFLKEFTACLF